MGPPESLGVERLVDQFEAFTSAAKVLIERTRAVAERLTHGCNWKLTPARTMSPLSFVLAVHVAGSGPPPVTTDTG